ncbi:MAG: DNA-damage-inducible protein D [uncultured Caballeronia sp.]|nr:MAG: DNA-damage-inducible protein D [uncultured Caballeronia sp.]
MTEHFEAHAQQTSSGVEFWLARDLQHLLGYAKWDNFVKVLNKAEIACETSGHAAAARDCVCTDLAQTYFAVQTRRAELIEQRLLDSERLVARMKLTSTEKGPSEVIFEQTGGNDDFGMIRSKGDHALFEKSTQQMKSHWKVPAKRPLADFAPMIVLKAKDFAAEITIINSSENKLGSEEAISREHINNNDNGAVRKTLLERGIRPETLPAAEDVKKVARRLASEDKTRAKNPEALDS